MPLPDVLRKLLTAAGPSGYETAPAAVFGAAARAFTDDVSVDVMGSVVARVPGTADGAPSLAIVGHIDEIGLIVTHIDDNGFLRFIGVGGWDPQILVGQRVELLTRDGVVPGVAGRKAIHLLRDEDRKKVPELRDLHIDIGAKDGDDARSRVRIGDVAVIAGEPVELANERVVSRSMDNRLGAFIALEAARLVAEAGGAPGDVLACGVVQEEISFGGARTSAFSLRPDVAIVVDVSHETGSPGVDLNQIGKHEFGAGPIIERGSLLNPAVFELLHDAAEREQIAFTVQASARSTGTDADAIHLSRAGVPTGGISIALRYMHSPVEMVQLDDIGACAKLIAAFATSLSAETSFALSGVGAAPMLLLFDIDGTMLIGAAAAHREAIHEALRVVHGVDRPYARGSQTAGRTDRDIARTLLVQAGVAAERIDYRAEDVRIAACEAYARLCPDDLSEFVAPGIGDLLERLGARDDTILSLVTGNYEPIARMKLRAAGIGGWFAAGQGGFGSDHESRAELPAIARRRAGQRADEPWPRERTLLIGDTPLDIACARADGVRVIAIATGPHPPDDLATADAVARDAHELGTLLDEFLARAR